MGTNSVLKPDRFSERFNNFLALLARREGWAADGRAMAKMIPERGSTFWMTRMNGAKALNTSDIAVVARAFGLDPYTFVRLVLAVDIDSVPRFPVGSPTDDEPTPLSAEDELQMRRDYELAAKLAGEKERK